MRLASARLLVTGVLFLGWMAYLAYQVATLPRADDHSLLSSFWPGQDAPTPLVLSRPQVLTSPLDVVAEVPEGRGEVEVTVKEVLYPYEDSPVHEGDKVLVTNVEDCRVPVHREERVAWTGPGLYLLPLRKAETPPARGKDKDATPRYEVVPIPPSPGYPSGPPRIYPATAEALAQYREIAKPSPGG